MNINSFIARQLFKQLNIPASSIKQFEIAGMMSDVSGRGLPRELIQLNAPLISRGLLNYTLLQMNRDWIYPFWAHRQLDPKTPSYIPRSQNPLLINVTCRNWTALGSPYGLYEAIIDPRGLVTPLPREWSIDVWLATSNGILFPSLLDHAEQQFDTTAPHVVTRFTFDELDLVLDSFVHPTRRGTDVLFHCASVSNRSTKMKQGVLMIAIRPFNPEGVAPVESIHFKSPRIAYVNNTVGVVFAEDPDGVAGSNRKEGDIATFIRKSPDLLDMFHGDVRNKSIVCREGLAHVAAGYRFALDPGKSKQVYCSAALDRDEVLQRSPVKQTWRVSFEQRRRDQREQWRGEVLKGAKFGFAHDEVHKIFEACRLTLLQLNDGEFISPGPFTYHKFWFRDAAIMLTALEMLGYPKRTGAVIDTFPRRLTADGFFRGPDGEWDSNGAVIWTVLKHYELNRSELWLREWYPYLVRAVDWIRRMRRKTRETSTTAKGLLPKSLSAEHLGMVDQYYWDSFWALAGVRCMATIAGILGRNTDEASYRKEAELFENDILRSFKRAEHRNGLKVIPASPTRPFDESAIGSICALYPLELFDAQLPHARNTLELLADRYVDDNGFFHPIIHSGYNPYLTLHIAHAFLLTGNVTRAWDIAERVFQQRTSTYTYPEAIHPLTGGGTMGDGHHGWAAAEIIMFIRNSLFREVHDVLAIFAGDDGRLIQRGSDCYFDTVPTTFGRIGLEISYTSSDKCTIRFSNSFFKDAGIRVMELHLPFEVAEYVAGDAAGVTVLKNEAGRATLRVPPTTTKLYLSIQ